MEMQSLDIKKWVDFMIVIIFIKTGSLDSFFIY